MTLDIIPARWREEFDRFLSMAMLPATLVAAFILFFSVDDPVRFLLSWVLTALFVGAAIGVIVFIASTLLP